MTLRAAVRAVLAGDATYAALLPGGIYPTSGADQTELSKDQTPAAYDSWGAVLASALVAEDSTIPDVRPGAMSFLRVWKWQQSGRTAIEAANAREVALLDNQRVTEGATVYLLRWAGFSGSGLKDQALGDASLGWSRWQVARLVG